MITSEAVKKATAKAAPTEEKTPKSPVVLFPEEENSISELIETAKKALFEFIKEFEKIKEGNINLERIKELIVTVEEAKEKHQENEEYQKTIEDFLERMRNRASSYLKENPSSVEDEEIETLLHNLFKDKPPVSVDLSKIDIDAIVKLYRNLQEAKKSGDAKKETAARGRLISLLKKEQKNIDEAFKKIEVLAQLEVELSKENPSLDIIKNILEKEENKALYLYLKNQLTELEGFKNKFEEIVSDKDIQRLFFLAKILSNQIKEHKEQLDSRFSKEFLEKRSKLFSIFTELPNAVGLSIRKLINSIDELKQAHTQRRKMESTKEVVKDVANVIGTPILFAGKYLVSNWYTLYMAFEAIMNAREQARREKEAKEAEEERLRREEEERLRREEEERLRREEEERLKLEEEERLRREEEERLRLEEEERLRREEEERLRREEEERLRREEEERLRREEEERLRREEEERLRREEEERLREEEKKHREEEAKEDTPEPTPPANRYKHLIGSNLISLLVSPAFGGNIWEQLKTGYATPDSTARVTYMLPGAKWYEFWKIRSGDFTLREIQEIWNWWGDVDLDEFCAEATKSK